MKRVFEAHAQAIVCEGCANAIKRALATLPGVQQVDIDVLGKKILAIYDSARINENDIRTQLDQAGFPTDPS
jgi:copper chaperone CopZ